ncbi:MAG: peptidylprolyl isomerase [Pirellulales bacterium]
MSGKEARPAPVAARRGLRLAWWILGIGAVGALVVAMSRSWGPDAAQAQAPRPTTARPPAAPAAPAGVSGQRAPTGAAPTSAAPGGVAPASTAPAAKTSGARTPAPAGKAGSQRPVQPAGATLPEKDLQVVALVNGEQITRQELAKECLERYGKEVLESIINKHLIQQACQQRGVNITEQDVNDEIERIAKKFGLSTDRWLQLLQEERNIAPNDYRRDIVWPTLALRALAAEQLKITGEELKKAFEAEYGEKVRVRIISVSSRKKADDLLRQAQAAPDKFGELAKDHSEDPSASVMGLIPPIRHHVGDPALEKLAFSLKKGQISPIIQVANQHLILKCEEHVEATYLGGPQLKQAQDQLQDRLRDQKLRTASAEMFKQLQERAQIVNVYNDPQKQQQQPGLAAVVNGTSITIRQLADECVTRHGPTVLDGEINRRILLQELKKRNRTVDDNDIQEEVARAADAYGYLKPDGTPDVDAWLKAITEKDGATLELYVRDAVWPSAALKKLAGSAAQVTEDDLKKGFESNYGERVEALAIVLGNQRQAQQVWEMARDNPTDNFFGELAHQYSIEPASRANFGKVPPIRRHGGQPTLEEAAFRLKPGELSSIVALGDKYVILRCTGRTKPVVQEFTPEVRQELARDLLEKKQRMAMAAEFDRLREVSQVDNFLAGTSTTGRAPRASSTPNLATPGQLVAPGQATAPRTATPRAATAPAGAAPAGPAPRAGAAKR